MEPMRSIAAIVLGVESACAYGLLSPLVHICRGATSPGFQFPI